LRADLLLTTVTIDLIYSNHFFELIEFLLKFTGINFNF